MRRFPYISGPRGLVGMVIGALIALGSATVAAAPEEAAATAATASAAEVAVDGDYVPDDVVAFEGELLRTLRGEGLSADEMEEVEAALADASALSANDVRPYPICDFACGVRCPVRWEHIRVVVDTVRQWQRRHLCRGQTDCGSLYECLYYVLIVHQTWLNVCNCDPDPSNPWDDYGCYWYSGASFLRQCTEPTCRRIRPSTLLDAVDAPHSLR